MAGTESMPASHLLSIPPELRNVIYDLIYTTPSPYLPLAKTSSAPASRPSLTSFGRTSPLDDLSAETSNRHLCGLVRCCRQLQAETQLLYLSRTVFNLPGPYATPEYFNSLLTPLSVDKISHIRHITLTGRINNLRALNESWNGRPFDNPNLYLSTLTIIPRRPQSHGAQYAEVADLSQSHTLAYVLAESLKSLKGVERIIVRNDEECFNPIVWRLVYRSLVYRLFKWGSVNLGLKFRQDGSGDEAWFEILLDPAIATVEDGWNDAPTEIQSLMGVSEPTANPS